MATVLLAQPTAFTMGKPVHHFNCQTAILTNGETHKPAARPCQEAAGAAGLRTGLAVSQFRGFGSAENGDRPRFHIPLLRKVRAYPARSCRSALPRAEHVRFACEMKRSFGSPSRETKGNYIPDFQSVTAWRPMQNHRISIAIKPFGVGTHSVRPQRCLSLRTDGVRPYICRLDCVVNAHGYRAATQDK